jgi:manganese transport protein
MPSSSQSSGAAAVMTVPVPAPAIGPVPAPAIGVAARPGARTHGRARRIAALCGPAFVVSVAYVDPGNFATNMSGGASYGFTLLWVIAAANLVAMFVQALAAKLGIATGQSLAALCRRHLPRPLTWLLWAQAEMIAIATDLAEFLGGAIALNLLFGVPLLAAACVTAVVSAVLLALAPRGRRRFETVITGLLAVICAGFVYQAVLSPHLSQATVGFVPHLAGRGSLVIAAGIVGATVMPHVIHLHSALTADQGPDHAGGAGRAETMRLRVRASRVDIGVALGVAGVVNMAMLVVAAAVLRGRDASTLPAIQSDLGSLLGRGAAAAFALALLASGLASSSVGTYAGQVIMEGFLRRRVPLVVRRLVTMAPAFALIAAGADPVRLLIVSQVALSVGLPSVLIPLVVLTGRRAIMGALVNRKVTTVVAVVVTAAVIGLDGVLLYLPATA